MRVQKLGEPGCEIDTWGTHFASLSDTHRPASLSDTTDPPCFAQLAQPTFKTLVTLLDEAAEEAVGLPLRAIGVGGYFD